MSEPTPPPISDDEARRLRQGALSALSHTQSSSPTAVPGSTSGGPSPEQRRGRLSAPVRTARRQPRWLVAISVVVVFVLVAGVVLHQLGIFPGLAAKSHTGPTGVEIALSLQGLDCLQDAAWSPDGQQIAVLGYRDQCPSDDPSSYNYQAGVLNIYAATTGKPVRTMLPDATALALPGIPSPPAQVQPTSAISDTSKPVLVYTHVLWSPDGKQIALTFYIGRWNAADTVEVAAYQGLVLVNADGTNERAALINETSHQYGALRWDTTTLGSLGLAAQQRYGNFVSVPPALSYSWGSGGQLLPHGALTNASSPTAPVGNPDGGSSFTLWQPGNIGVFPEPGDPSIYTSGTAFLAWSPDGRYLIDAVSLQGIVHPVGKPSPSAGELNLVGRQSAPNVAIRDEALQRLLASLTASAASGGHPLDDIAWSPNGHVLAAIPDDISSSSSGRSDNSAPVAFYDCATGRTMSTLQPQSNSHISTSESFADFYIISISLLRWSADGSHVLVYSDQLGTITIWGPGMLPQSASA